MIPRSRRAALLEILAAERQVKQLALESYQQWLPVARARVLGTVTAAADDEPPDPDAVAQTGADWEAILAGVFLPGLAQIVFAQLAADLAALGVSAADIRGLIDAAARAVRPDGSRAPADGAPRPGRTPGDPDPSPDDGVPEPADDPRWAAERDDEQRREQQRQADERDDERQAERDRRAAERREQERRDDERRERERQAAERQAAERRERERRKEQQREADRQAAERQEAEEAERARQEAQRRESERRAEEQREQARRDQARKDADAETERARRDEERRAEQQRERERRDEEEAEQARQQRARRAAEERDAARRAALQRERDRQEAERQERARRERERRDAERRERERVAAELEEQARAEQARLEAEQRETERQADAEREQQRQEQARLEAEQREQQAREEAERQRAQEEAAPDPSGTDRDQNQDRDDDDDVDLTPRLVARIPGAADYVDDYLSVVRNRMVRTPDTAFRLIAAELAEANRLGESPQQQRERVARVLDAENLDTFGGRRAALVARTETCGALNAARLEAGRVWQDISGESLEKAWLATIDARTRDTHFAVDGQRVPLPEEFTLANGVRMLYPGEPGAPAAEVCNCRCALMILAVDEELPAETDRQTERGPGDANVRNREGSQRDEIDRRREARGIVRARDDPDGVGQINAAGAPPLERIPAMRRFTAILAHLGERTDDGRLLDIDMDLRFRATPLPLRWQRQDLPEHMEAFTVAAITDIGRDGTKIIGDGYMLDTPEAAEAIVQIEAGVTNPSVDLADVEWEIRDQDGQPVDLEAPLDEDTKLVFTMTSAIVTAATLVSIPAFGTTSITLAAEDDADSDEDAESVAAAALLAAAGAPFKPSAHMFEDPGLTEPTPLHQTDDGRIIGHLAVWGTCHVGIPDRCVTPPHSETDYAHFHTSSVITADGTRLPAGRLTVGTGHAKHSLGAAAAAAHYDNTGTCWAYVRMGEDDIGPWVSGVVHPDATDRQVREGLSAPLSGDWRNIGGNLELVAALSVNTPGFPVIAGRTDEYGLAASLIASLSPRQSRPPAAPSVLRTVAQETVKEFRQAEVRYSRALALIEQRRATERQTRKNRALGVIQQRRKTAAAAIVAGVRGRS